MLNGLMKRSCAPLALALMTLSCTAMAQGSSGGVRYGVAPALDCATISKTAARGSWVEPNGVGTEFGMMRLVRLSFSDPVATDTIRVAMNEVGFRDLALIDIEDTKGGWHTIWEGHMAATAPGFPRSCFESQFANKQIVQALRFTFRNAPGEIDVNHAALLRR
jgi:hypothetical protein